MDRVLIAPSESVFGEPTMAEDGILSCVPAGRPEQIDRIRPYLVGV